MTETKADSDARAFRHRTVMLDETLSCLAPRAGGRYADVTLGGGGHALAVLEASAPDGRLVGVDRDETALAAARERLAEHAERVELVHGAFAELPRLLAHYQQGSTPQSKPIKPICLVGICHANPCHTLLSQLVPRMDESRFHAGKRTLLSLLRLTLHRKSRSVNPLFQIHFILFI